MCQDMDVLEGAEKKFQDGGYEKYFLTMNSDNA